MAAYCAICGVPQVPIVSQGPRPMSQVLNMLRQALLEPAENRNADDENSQGNGFLFDILFVEDECA